MRNCLLSAGALRLITCERAASQTTKRHAEPAGEEGCESYCSSYTVWSGFLLRGAITHQVVSVWAPVRGPAGNFIVRYRAVGTAHFANAVVALYLLQMVLGSILYTITALACG